MDIHVFLAEWNAFEPHRCLQRKGDYWEFQFDQPRDDDKKQVICDVISVRGVGVIEDLVKECIEQRQGWSHELIFDRSEELFLAHVTTDNNVTYNGLESLNPGIAILSAYLNSLKSAPQDQVRL